MWMEIKHVSKTYEGTVKETLQDISLEIKEGEFICIVGPSGCGKSTLLNALELGVYDHIAGDGRE